jgi:hypothetical protein
MFCSCLEFGLIFDFMHWDFPHFLLHAVAEDGTPSIFRTVLSDLAHISFRRALWFISFFTLPRAVFFSTAGASRMDLTLYRHVIKPLTSCALRRHCAFRVGFHSNFDITHVQCCLVQLYAWREESCPSLRLLLWHSELPAQGVAGTLSCIVFLGGLFEGVLKPCFPRGLSC